MEKSKGKGKEVERERGGSMARGVGCFRGSPYRNTKPTQRSKFTTEAKEKVREVRRQRACLRCKLLKIQVRRT